jgi:hypothetical protein
MLNYTNISIQIGGASVYATQASFNMATPLEAVYAVGTVGKASVQPNGPIKGTFTADYHIADGDPGLSIFQGIVTNMGALVNPITVSFGGQSYAKAYLTSHTANGQANQLATAKVSFDVYAEGNSVSANIGGGGGGGAAGGNSNIGFGHGAGSSAGGAGVTNANSFSYESSIQYDFVFKIGSITPQAVYVSRASEKLIVEGYDLAATVSMCGANGSASASVGGICGGGNANYSVNGQVMSAEGSVSAGQVGKGKVTVVKYY